nr:MAG TPA: hypothetical protein [Caudoviricetes sp.]
MSFVIMLLQCRVYLPSDLLLTAHHWAINVFLIVLLKSVAFRLGCKTFIQALAKRA